MRFSTDQFEPSTSLKHLTIFRTTRPVDLCVQRRRICSGFLFSKAEWTGIFIILVCVNWGVFKGQGVREWLDFKRFERIINVSLGGSSGVCVCTDVSNWLAHKLLSSFTFNFCHLEQAKTLALIDCCLILLSYTISSLNETSNKHTMSALIWQMYLAVTIVPKLIWDQASFFPLNLASK